MTHPLPAARFVCGQPITRVDGQLKATGKAPYAADNQIPGLVYAALVCSTVACAGIDHVDTGAALRHRDVLRVLTDFTGMKLPFDIRQVSYFGQPIAVVVATTLEAAAHGASLVDVRYTSWPSLTDIDAPQAVTQPGHFIRDYTRGDAEQAIRRTSVVTDLQFSIARNNHNPMELPATIAKWDGEKLTVWDKVQSISSARQSYADAMGVPQENVRVISPFVGGAFGSAGRPGRINCWPPSPLGGCNDRSSWC